VQFSTCCSPEGDLVVDHPAAPGSLRPGRHQRLLGEPRFVGRRIEVRVDLDPVVATCGSVEVARHRRCLAKHQSILDATHAMTLRMMRAEEVPVSPLETMVEERDRPHSLSSTGGSR
jgi:hypothetical protein